MTKRDIYQEITDKIVSVLDAMDVKNFEAPFRQLAANGMPFNPVTDHQYSGINVPSLWCDREISGFPTNEWATFKQWKEKGAQVRKGEKGSPIIFFKTLNKQEENATGEAQEITIPMLRHYTVFNAAQVDGYTSQDQDTGEPIDLVTRIKRADEFCATTGADIRHGEPRAYYH